MLVISRRPGQSFLIGRDIEVFVVEADGSRLRIGINAPRGVHVLRRELLAHFDAENSSPSENGSAIQQAVVSLATTWGATDEGVGNAD